MANVRTRLDKDQSNLIDQLMKYEDIGVEYYSNQDPAMRNLTK